MLIVFDFDSTLMDGESIDLLAKLNGTYEIISSITKEAMEGRLDFHESIVKKVALLKGLRLDTILEEIKRFPLMNGAINCVQTLRKNGHIVVCFSGGFRIVTEYFKNILNLNATFSNILHHKDGVLSGFVGGDMMFNDSKGIMLKNLKSILNLESKDCVAIGDGANDLSMFAESDVRIAFCAKEILKANATHIISNKNLNEVLSIIK